MAVESKMVRLIDTRTSNDTLGPVWSRTNNSIHKAIDDEQIAIDVDADIHRLNARCNCRPIRLARPETLNSMIQLICHVQIEVRVDEETRGRVESVCC